uniref:Transmembrane protein n=1 Tax=Syphacia muris TaxID=451379 RepID=A0A0N5ACJ3_9BILA
MPLNLDQVERSLLDVRYSRLLGKIFMQLKMLRALKISARSFSIQRSVLPTKAPSADGKKPPTVEEFNYLDPKGWQIGVGLKSIFVGGKLLPRLPEGTKVGNLVMGKYGLYHPERRRQSELFREAISRGEKAHTARPIDRFLFYIVCTLAVISALTSIFSVASLIKGGPLWPFDKAKDSEAS